MDKYFWLKLLKPPDIVLYYDEEEMDQFYKTKVGLEQTLSDEYIIETDAKKREIRIWKPPK